MIILVIFGAIGCAAPPTPTATPTPTSTPTQTQTPATLEVKVLTPDGKSIPNLEVDLWTGSAPYGPPDAGVAYTNESGIAIFKIPSGNYKIGFNLNTFPKEYIYPKQQVPVEVTEKIIQKTIQLQA